MHRKRRCDGTYDLDGFYPNFACVCVFIYISPHIQCQLVGILEQGFLFLLRTHLTLCFNGRVQHASADLVQF